MTNLLRKNISEHIALSDEEFNLFSAPFKLIHIKKKQFLLRQGEVCRFEAFVNKGCLKVFHIDDKGFENILNFATENCWFNDIDSFMHQTPAHLHIQALEDSDVLVIGKKDKELLYKQLPKIERLVRILCQISHAALQRRMIENLSLNAEERYNSFITTYPMGVQRLSNIQIAAYLGISHEFLSKIRKRRSQKKGLPPIY